MSLNRPTRKRRHLLWVVVLLSQYLLPYFAAADEPDKTVLLATTTSTDNSGLLDYILPYMQADTGYTVRIISTGTGKALKMGAAGDVDIILVHAKSSELAFIAAGHGVARRPIMFNDFIVVGPDDALCPDGSALSLDEVFQCIVSQAGIFVSRGDDSGTHKKELEIWRSTGIEPGGAGYREVGQGMGKTLQIADQLGAYTLTDRGTWIFSRDRLAMKIIYQRDQRLRNQYSVILVNPARHKTNYPGAKAVSDWLVSRRGQALIDSYRIKGQQPFYANAE